MVCLWYRKIEVKVLVTLLAILMTKDTSGRFLEQPAEGTLFFPVTDRVTLSCSVDDQYLVDWRIVLPDNNDPREAANIIDNRDVLAPRNFTFTGVATTSSTVSFDILEHVEDQTNNGTIITCIAQRSITREAGTDTEVIFYGAPPSPTDLNVTEDELGSLNISWSLGFIEGVPVNYTLTVLNLNATSAQPIIIAGLLDQHYVFESSRPCDVYSFTVTAVTAAGNSTPSQEIIIIQDGSSDLCSGKMSTTATTFNNPGISGGAIAGIVISIMIVVSITAIVFCVWKIPGCAPVKSRLTDFKKKRYSSLHKQENHNSGGTQENPDGGSARGVTPTSDLPPPLPPRPPNSLALNSHGNHIPRALTPMPTRNHSMPRSNSSSSPFAPDDDCTLEEPNPDLNLYVALEDYKPPEESDFLSLAKGEKILILSMGDHGTCDQGVLWRGVNIDKKEGFVCDSHLRKVITLEKFSWFHSKKLKENEKILKKGFFMVRKSESGNEYTFAVYGDSHFHKCHIHLDILSSRYYYESLDRIGFKSIPQLVAYFCQNCTKLSNIFEQTTFCPLPNEWKRLMIWKEQTASSSTTSQVNEDRSQLKERRILPMKPHHNQDTWYCEVDRLKSHEMMDGKPNGTFLCRPTQNSKVENGKVHTHTIDIKYNGQKHLKVFQIDNKYSLSSPYNHSSLIELILFYSEKSLELHNPGLMTTLQYPINA